MGGDVERVKERLDIAEIISGYIKIEKAGANFKARCPFHNEKTPSFFISAERQTFYCFGCGAKGDVLTFVEEMEGLDFRAALRQLAEKAGIELEYRSGPSKTEKDSLLAVTSSAAEFFENQLKECPEALKYLEARGLSPDSVKKWRIGYAPDEWRSLYSHLVALGHGKDLIIKAGLAKVTPKGGEGGSKKDPYDVFRGRIIFPLLDTSGRIIAFSGRALAKDAIPKYLNSPDTLLFNKGEVLYGLDRAKDAVRKKDYAVLVEGQVDLVLSHQAGVANTVAASGTAFTPAHLSRLKRLSGRIILAFDGDEAGEKAAEKSTRLALSLGMEVKIADLPAGSDPADVICTDAELWRGMLRKSVPAVEHFLAKCLAKEQDPRKSGKLVEARILPMVALIESAIEQSHFVSLIAKRAGLREEALWQDLRRIKSQAASRPGGLAREFAEDGDTPAGALGSGREVAHKTYMELIEERLTEIEAWQKELEAGSREAGKLGEEKAELLDNLALETLKQELAQFLRDLAVAEGAKDEQAVIRLSKEIQSLHQRQAALEEKKKRV